MDSYMIITYFKTDGDLSKSLAESLTVESVDELGNDSVAINGTEHESGSAIRITIEYPEN